MKKTFETFHATINTTTNHYEMSQNWLTKMAENLPEGYELKKNSKVENMYAIMKNGKRAYIIDVIAKPGKVTNDPAKKVESKKASAKKEDKAPVKKEAKANVSRETISGHKAKDSGYIVVYKNKGDKKENKNTTMANCAEIKAFLKTLSKKNLEYLRIYDSANNECRKSAWVG